MKKSILIILIIGFLVYLPSLFNGFVWDDEEQIVNNTIIHSLSNTPLFFKGSTFNTGGAGLSGWYYKPLMTMSFAISYAFFKNNAFGFHLFQLIIHLLNSILVFLIFYHFFKKEPLTLILSLIFAIHPGISEAVFYISATQEVLFTFFGLLTFYLAIKIKNLPLITIITFIFLTLALLSKEAAFVIIPILILYCLFFEKEKLLPLISGIFFSVFLYLFLRLFVARITFGFHKIVPIAKASFTERLITVPFILFSYLKLIFFPKDLAIAQHFVIKNIFDNHFYGSLILITFFLLLVIYYFLKLRSKIFNFFLFWYLASISLVLNIFPLDMTLAERWLYFPIIGMLGMVGWLIKELKATIKTKIITVSLLIILSLRTIIRGFDWRSGLSLFSHDISYSKNSFDLENNLGVELFRKGEIKESRKYFEESIKLAPEWWTNYNNLGAYYQHYGDLKKAEKLYRTSIKNGDYYLAYENLANILFSQKRFKEAISFCKESLKKLPYNLNLRFFLTLSYYQEKDFDNAEKSAYQLFLLSPSQENYNFYLTIKERKLKIKE